MDFYWTKAKRQQGDMQSKCRDQGILTVHRNVMVQFVHVACINHLSCVVHPLTGPASGSGDRLFAQCNTWIIHELHLISNRSCEVQIHGLISTIRGLAKSIICAQHIYIPIITNIIIIIILSSFLGMHFISICYSMHPLFSHNLKRNY